MDFLFPNSLKERWRNWFSRHAQGPYAKVWLFVLTFSEATFFLIPPDIILVAILMTGAQRWIYYASLTTIASVLGAVFAYIIGAFFFDTIGIRIIEFYNLTDEISTIQGLFEKNNFIVTFSAAFTPIPYKLFVISAGFFKISFPMFLLGITLGRGLRFFLVAYITKLFGAEVERVFFRYLDIITLGIVLIITFILFEYYGLINIV